MKVGVIVVPAIIGEESGHSKEWIPRNQERSQKGDKGGLHEKSLHPTCSLIFDPILVSFIDKY